MLITVFISFIMSIFIALQDPIIQKFTIRIAGGYISSKTGADIQIGRLYISPNFTIQIDHFLVKDLNDNNLLKVEQLKVRPIMQDIIQGNIHIGRVELTNAETNLITYEDSTSMNFQFLIDAFRKGDRVIRVILLLEICFAAPVFEELAFRLALFRWLSGRGLSVMNASLLTSALFAVAHFLWWGIPGLFLFSLILCRVRRQQDIFSCIGVHSLYNFFVALMTLMASELV